MAKQRPGVELFIGGAALRRRVATALIQRIGRLSRDSSRVEVPFEQIAPAEAQVWTEENQQRTARPYRSDRSDQAPSTWPSAKGTRQHGFDRRQKPAPAKSTLFHVIITNLALWCSPEQVEFYLVDFKKKASSSSATVPNACRMPESSPSRATASLV